MVLRPLGNTGLKVSPIGFGAFKIGRNQGVKYPHDYDLPDESEVERLLNGVLDAGVNYIDTAPAYGLSEERIGRAIAHRRGEFVLSTKVGETFENGRSNYDFTAATAHRGIDESLRRLRTDRLDVVFVHARGDEYGIEPGMKSEACPIVEALRDRIRKGDVRNIGLSARTPAAATAAMGWADVLMVEYHLEDRSHEKVIHAAAASGVGVVVKKGLSSGRLAPPHAIPFVLAHPGVASMVIGGLNPAHLRENLRLAADFRNFMER